MFIDARWNQVRPPSGGPCQSMNARRVLLTLPSWRRAAASRLEFYKHYPPGGGFRQKRSRGRPEMKILSLSTCPLDPLLGSGKTRLRWSEGLRELGHTVDMAEPRDYETWQPLRGFD